MSNISTTAWDEANNIAIPERTLALDNLIEGEYVNTLYTKGGNPSVKSRKYHWYAPAAPATPSPIKIIKASAFMIRIADADTDEGGQNPVGGWDDYLEAKGDHGTNSPILGYKKVKTYMDYITDRFGRMDKMDLNNAEISTGITNMVACIKLSVSLTDLQETSMLDRLLAPATEEEEYK